MKSRMLWRRALLLVAVCLVPGVSLGAAPLHILLSNDDGFEAPGLRALHERLEQEGHRVMVAAPQRNFSGSSASLSQKPVRAEQRAAAAYALTASPASCVLWGLERFVRDYGRAPDVVLSGINKGANIGALIHVSGTVGAATMAALGLGAVAPVPAIAISTDLLSPHDEDHINMKHYREVADFAARLVAVLAEQRGTLPLLPPRMVLNVNYPSLPASQVRGVRLSKQGLESPFRIGYRALEDGDGGYRPEFRAAPDKKRTEQDDVSAHQQGYITLVPLALSRTERQSARRAFLPPLLEALKP